MEGTKTTENRYRLHGINSRQGGGTSGDGQARIPKKARVLMETPIPIGPFQPIPTNKLKNRLINIMKKMKTESEMDEKTYKRIYPTGARAPKFYGLPKIHKEEVPSRPMVSSKGCVTYGVAKELSRILKPLVVKSIYHEKQK